MKKYLIFALLLPLGMTLTAKADIPPETTEQTHLSEFGDDTPNLNFDYIGEISPAGTTYNP